MWRETRHRHCVQGGVGAGAGGWRNKEKDTKRERHRHTPGKAPAKAVCLVSSQLPCSASDRRRGIQTPNRVSDPRARYPVTWFD